MTNDNPPQNSSRGFFAALILVGISACGMAVLIKDSYIPSKSPQIGTQFPVLEATGWINSPPPEGEDLKGKVLLVDAWAYWCGPCRMATPTLLHLYEKYKDQQVVFVGLTSEGEDEESVRKTRDYVTSENVPWPNGFGASKVLGSLNARSIPQFWVVDRQNRIVAHVQGWGFSAGEELERALIQALKPSADQAKQ